MQTAVPEAMVQSQELTDFGFRVSDSVTAIGMGPGIGKSPETSSKLKLLIQCVNNPQPATRNPLLIDADGLNILSENKTWLGFLQPGTVLTPHPKEFARLFGEEADMLKRLSILISNAVKYRCIIVLKGAHTAIALPDGTVWFNSTGNPGLAKGGSGDVLSGIITGLLAQGYPSSQAALLGVYLHGLSADIAVQNSSEEALTPSDVIESLGKAFKAIQK